MQLEQPVGYLLDGSQIETPLVTEVVKHQSVRDARLLGDVTDGDLVVALGGELMDGDVDQALPRRGRPLLPRTRHLTKQTTSRQLERHPKRSEK